MNFCVRLAPPKTTRRTSTTMGVCCKRPDENMNVERRIQSIVMEFPLVQLEKQHRWNFWWIWPDSGIPAWVVHSPAELLKEKKKKIPQKNIIKIFHGKMFQWKRRKDGKIEMRIFWGDAKAIFTVCQQLNNPLLIYAFCVHSPTQRKDQENTGKLCECDTAT